DSGAGPELWVGGFFDTSAAGDTYLARWSCPPPQVFSGTAYCTAGTTSHGCVPAIQGVGVPSASAGSNFTLLTLSVEGQKSGLVFYGVTSANAAPWGSGSTSFLCVKPPTQRTATSSSGGTVNACDGALSIDWNAYIASHPGALGQPFVGGET